MKKRKIEEVRSLMESAMRIRGINERIIGLIIDDYLGAQLEGHVTHGLGKFLLLDKALAKREGQPEIIAEGPAYALINGNKELGHACASYALDYLIPKAKEYGIAMVAAFNASRYGRLKVIGKALAQSDLVGIILNNAGPKAVTPFGGIDPIFGTNPICFAFPCRPEPLVIDFSTSKRVWGEIRQAILEKRDLPEGAFLDKDGQITTDTGRVEAVLPFDGPKGYSLCLAIEILAGALIGAKMGINVGTQYDLGFLFIAINPTVFSAFDKFYASVAKLLEDVRTSHPVEMKNPVRVPGDRSNLFQSKAEEEGYVGVDDKTFACLIQMSQGLTEGIDSNDKTD